MVARVGWNILNRRWAVHKALEDPANTHTSKLSFGPSSGLGKFENYLDQRTRPKQSKSAVMTAISVPEVIEYELTTHAFLVMEGSKAI